MAHVKLNIVKIKMSSHARVDHREEIDDRNVKFTYSFDGETRKRIKAVREKYNNRLKRKFAITYESLQLARESERQNIIELAEKANQELSAINPDLKAEVKFIPLNFTEIAQGELYGEIAASIQKKVFATAFQRISPLVAGDKKTALPERSKEALRKMITQLQTFNVLEDEDIDAKIQEIKAKIESEALVPLVDTLSQQITEADDRWGAIEL